MDAIEKLGVLSRDSQYDLACACGTGKEEHRRRGKDGSWLYPVALPQGGFTVLLKTLLSNVCSNDCKYCPLRTGSDVVRCTLQPEEVASIFMQHLRRKKVFGLFLSSGVINSPDNTMDKLIATAHLLRKKHQYRGYMHLKIIPGASDAAVEEAVSLSTAVSLNIETPGRQHSAILSTRKDYDKDIMRPIQMMGKLTGRGTKFSQVKCTTQFIVGASDETDNEILQSMRSLYKELNFKRVYFSAYQKGLGSSDIPGERRFLTSPDERFMREHRLYQVDFLIRKYGFDTSEIPLDPSGYLSMNKDPKEMWAEINTNFFPLNINTADRQSLLRVPGLGPDTVKSILLLRRQGRIYRPEDLRIKGKRLQKIKRYVVFE
ncbi:MAG TPA: radical SAM protein [Dissulfurispiraceae bacterium]|nr:radical SAM protein [Dissulfurispiraceae bacterium]